MIRLITLIQANLGMLGKEFNKIHIEYKLTYMDKLLLNSITNLATHYGKNN